MTTAKDFTDFLQKEKSCGDGIFARDFNTDSPTEVNRNMRSCNYKLIDPTYFKKTASCFTLFNKDIKSHPYQLPEKLKKENK